jgi:hypothetical protein
MGVDYSATEIAVEYELFQFHSVVSFPLDSVLFDLEPGMLFKMTDGDVTKELVMKYITIDHVDHFKDTVAGFTQAGAFVSVNVYHGIMPWRTTFANEDGYWEVDFSLPQDDQEVYDLQPDSDAHAMVADDDGDGTGAYFRIPNPVVYARANDDQIEGWDWLIGETVTIDVDDPATEEYPDYNRFVLVEIVEGDPHSFLFFTEGYDLKPGEIITASGDSAVYGPFTKTLVVSSLTFTNVDLEADIVYGIADPGQSLSIWTCDETSCDPNRFVTANEFGYWEADFSNPGPNEGEEQTSDLRPAIWIDSNTWDEDGDATFYGTNIPNPSIFARANFDKLDGWGWPIGETVIIDIDDPSTETNPDYSQSILIEILEEDPRSFQFFIEDYDLKPGDIITAFVETAVYGSITKTLVVSSLTITNVDLESDIVYGIAETGESFYVWASDGMGYDIYRYVTTDGFGEWEADFGNPGPNEGEELTFDLRSEIWIDSNIWDDDGDRTLYGVNIPNPVVYTRANDDQIEGWDWPVGEMVTIDVDDPFTEANPDYTRTVLIEIVEDDPHSFLFFTDGYDLKPGDIITAFADTAVGCFEKTLEVSNVMITDVDLDTDIVYGLAQSEQSVEAWACDAFTCYPRYVTADIEGNWSANFSVPGVQEEEKLTSDLRHGIWIDSSIPDDDGDKTLYGFNIDTSSDFLPWVQVNEDGFGNPENKQIPALSAFKGYLYAGVWNWHEDQSSAEVWRTDGSAWERVDQRDANGCAALTVFKGYLYCGSWGKDEEGGKIWRSSNGLTWIEDGKYVSAGIARFAVLKDILFASTWESNGTEIWKTTNGIDWKLSTTPGFGNTNNIGGIASEIFNGKLYWGTLNFDTGAQIWRTDGIKYKQVMGDGFGSPDNVGITALEVFDDFLYAVTGNQIRIEVWRTSNGVKWENVLILPMYLYPLDDILINGLEVLDGYLYLIVRNDVTGLDVWRTPDGMDWTQVAFGGFDDNNNRWSYWDNAITTFKDKLYIATNNFETGGEVWTFIPIE